VFTAGPLCWSIPLFRNSLILHSLDQLTSVMIHLLPSLAVWALRWNCAPSAAAAAACSFTVCSDAECSSSLWDAVTVPFGFWMLWAVLYYVKVFILSARKVEERGYDTLFVCAAPLCDRKV
jgi:hypothetical protein